MLYVYDTVKVYCKRGAKASMQVIQKSPLNVILLGSQCCYSVLMCKNTNNSNEICGLSRTRLRPIADFTERGYCLQEEILSELQTKSYLLRVIALGSVLVCPVEVFSRLAVTLLHVKLGWHLQASVDSLDDITFLLLKNAFIDVCVHLLVHEVPQLREVVILEAQTERRTQ